MHLEIPRLAANVTMPSPINEQPFQSFAKRSGSTSATRISTVASPGSAMRLGINLRFEDAREGLPITNSTEAQPFDCSPSQSNQPKCQVYVSHISWICLLLGTVHRVWFSISPASKMLYDHLECSMSPVPLE